jgi:hypothetical protein
MASLTETVMVRGRARRCVRAYPEKGMRALFSFEEAGGEFVEVAPV